MNEEREVWLDWMRVAACFMVMVVHSTEPFYLGGEGSLILTEADAWWVAFFDCVVRACVPLFIVVSSYLQFPTHYPTGQFLRRRAVRVLIPFAFWSLVYALAWGEPTTNLKGLLLNFNYAAGHLWFVYMLVGLYLLIPMLSPWAERVGKRELQFYLFLCFLTTIIPFVRAWAEPNPPVIYGPLGIPNPARYPLWGEASWNAYGVFYYLSGFIGYMLLGLYLRRFAPLQSWLRTLPTALGCWLVGFGICFAGFLVLEKFVLNTFFEKIPRVFSHVCVVVVVLISFVIFSANGLSGALSDIGNMFCLGEIPFWSVETAYYLKSYAVVIIVAMLGATPILKSIVLKMKETRPGSLVCDILEPVFLVVMLLVVTAYFVDGSYSPFLYFRF